VVTLSSRTATGRQLVPSTANLGRSSSCSHHCHHHYHERKREGDKEMALLLGQWSLLPWCIEYLSVHSRQLSVLRLAVVCAPSHDGLPWFFSSTMLAQVHMILARGKRWTWTILNCILVTSGTIFMSSSALASGRLVGTMQSSYSPPVCISRDRTGRCWWQIHGVVLVVAC
jgi:hypothetical protein